MNKKIIFIPGWMKCVGFYKNYDGLDIWKRNFTLSEKVEADYIIAHSLGVNFLLSKISFNRETKIILINPLISESNKLFWIWRWLRFVFLGSPMVDRKMNLLNFFSAFYKFVKLEKNSYTQLLEKVSLENIIIVRGKNDNAFCDKNEAEIIKNNNIEIIELDNMGHEWNEKYNDVINKIIEN